MEYHGIKPCREQVPKTVNIQGSPSAGAGHPNKEVVRQKHGEACMDVQGAPGQTQGKKRSLQKEGGSKDW